MPDYQTMMELAKAKMQKEMPDEMSGVSVNPDLRTGWFNRLTAPNGAVAVKHTLRDNISYDPHTFGLLNFNQNDVEGILAHELTHVRQDRNRTLTERLLQSFTPQLPYAERGDELEAQQTEKNRNLANHVPNYGDINLPKDPLTQQLLKRQGK